MANEYRTLPIGKIFTYNDNKYKVCKSNICNYTCTSCAFNEMNCESIKPIRGNCTKSSRTDNIQAYYEQINNETMKKDSDNIVCPTFNTDNSLNDLQIDYPNGYSIDVEHSDLSKGIIKFKKDNITLKDIPDGVRDEIKINGFISKGSTYYKYLKKLKAIATLIDIANYYNKGWKPDFNNDKESKYYIGFSKRLNKYNINMSILCTDTFIYFKNKEDAQAVINNYNFRDILDVIYKD